MPFVNTSKDANELRNDIIVGFRQVMDKLLVKYKSTRSQAERGYLSAQHTIIAEQYNFWIDVWMGEPKKQHELAGCYEPNLQTRALNTRMPQKAKKLGSKGGEARAAKLSQEQRTKIAKKAAETRWQKTNQSSALESFAWDHFDKKGV